MSQERDFWDFVDKLSEADRITWRDRQEFEPFLTQERDGHVIVYVSAAIDVEGSQIVDVLPKAEYDRLRKEFLA